MAYMDYIYLVSIDTLREAIHELGEELGKLGLRINLSKCRATKQIPGLSGLAIDRDLQVLGASSES